MEEVESVMCYSSVSFNARDILWENFAMDKEAEESTNEIVALYCVFLYEEIIREYTLIALKSELTDVEIEFLDSIFTEAEQDWFLNLLLGELDFLIGQRLGLLDEASVERYKDQQAWLREHLEQILLEQDNLIEAQMFLQEVGFYKGPIDGIWGTRARTAATQYRMEAQHLLQQRGLYCGDIDGEMGNQSVIAVQEFQKSQNLEPNGVLLRHTFSMLQCTE